MNTSSSPSENPTPRWKVALIPVLGTVLLLVLWPAGGTKTQLERHRPAPSGGRDAHPEQAQGSGLPPLPHFDVSTALDFNPFETPDSIRELIQGPSEPAPELVDADVAAQEQADQAQATADRLQKLRVSVVLTNPSGRRGEASEAAIIGARVVRVGDVLDGGARVIRIDSNGILVRLEPEAGREARRPASIR